MRTAGQCLLLSLMLGAALPSGVAQTFPRDDFSAHRFYAAPGANDYLMVESPDLGDEGSVAVGTLLGYAHRPFAADDLDCLTFQTSEGCNDGMPVETDLVASMLTLQLFGSVTFLERMQVGLNLPVLLFLGGEGYEYIEEDGDRRIASRTAAEAGEAAGLSDPRISAKVRILDPDAVGNGVSLAASAYVTVPVGHYMWPLRFAGDRSPNVGGLVVGGFRYDAFRLALNLGFAFREEQTNLRSAVGPEMIWGAAAGYRPHTNFEIVAEATGATSFGQRFDSEAPTEARGALVLHIAEWSARLGGGAGIFYGVGVPVFRVFGGISLTPTLPADSDSDGLDDRDDACPTVAEDLDGFADEDGCPDLDNDGDGVPDATDACDDEHEDLDGFEDEDGCPDLDDDGDGISDGYDSCPRVAEDFDGDRDTDGCPDDDADGDGLTVPDDQCPDVAEDFDGFGDEDGCPEEDFDEDTVPDDQDACPEEAEDFDGFEDEDGCPEGASGPRGR